VRAVSPNETKIKILFAVLQLERFTVADLCLNTGLERNQVYREISELQKREILSSATFKEPGGVAPAHRAPKLYSLSTKPQKKAELQAEVERFVPPGYGTEKPSAHLEKAQRALSWLTSEVLGASSASLKDTNLESWQTELGTRFEEAQQALKRAVWESELDLSEGATSEDPIAVAARLHRTLSDRFTELVQMERARRERAAAEADWRKALPLVAKALLKTAIPVSTAAALLPTFSPAGAFAVGIAVRELYKIIEKGFEKGGLYEQILQSLRASLERDLYSAGSKPDVLAALAKHLISYSNTAQPALECIRQLNREAQPNYQLQFDEANLALLQKRMDEAYACWKAYRNQIRAGAPALLPSVICRMPGNSWSDFAYRDAIKEINQRSAAAITILSEAPFGSADDQTVRPQLFNPLYGKNYKEPEYIPLSENVGGGLGLHLAGSPPGSIIEPGVPKLVFADLICESGIDVENAWNTVLSLSPEERIVKVEFIGTPDPQIREETGQILRDHFPGLEAFA
jgi:hypothetical protein